jgi:hypothetical protein
MGSQPLIHLTGPQGPLDQWSSTGARIPPAVRENIERNRLNLEPALILALKKIRPRIEALACQKQAQSSH